MKRIEIVEVNPLTAYPEDFVAYKCKGKYQLLVNGEPVLQSDCREDLEIIRRESIREELAQEYGRVELDRMLYQITGRDNMRAANGDIWAVKAALSLDRN